ncbi:hypothetical protein BOTNAR_0169g00150 [Botryotinia narcissicola]|uniref:Uncharacterized protein n=1 Tax=Botryotinia narcissicola TaxID=278944 RepID=A0A4Z1IC38_9HELO|nr:hypothetical protein BOTNAR_0169g00150 [Botryotinia narcissicola]
MPTVLRRYWDRGGSLLPALVGSNPTFLEASSSASILTSETASLSTPDASPPEPTEASLSASAILCLLDTSSFYTITGLSSLRKS